MTPAFRKKRLKTDGRVSTSTCVVYGKNDNYTKCHKIRDYNTHPWRQDKRASRLQLIIKDRHDERLARTLRTVS